ncbi:MAG: hypothetical protein AB7F31_03845 [Parachlamydiales bacterium]
MISLTGLWSAALLVTAWSQPTLAKLYLSSPTERDSPTLERRQFRQLEPLIATYRPEGIYSWWPSSGHPSSPRSKDLASSRCALSDYHLPRPLDDRSQSGVEWELNCAAIGNELDEKLEKINRDIFEEKLAANQFTGELLEAQEKWIEALEGLEGFLSERWDLCASPMTASGRRRGLELGDTFLQFWKNEFVPARDKREAMDKA